MAVVLWGWKSYACVEYRMLKLRGVRWAGEMLRVDTRVSQIMHNYKPNSKWPLQVVYLDRKYFTGFMCIATAFSARR